MSKTVLMIEESAALRKVTGFVLGTAGYRLLTAANAGGGLALLDGRGIDLIIVQEQMADMDGVNFVQAVKRRPAYESVPVLVMLTSGDGSRALWGSHPGPGAWMIKPFHPDQLLAVVSKMMAH